jgi:hypothetical protein
MQKLCDEHFSEALNNLTTIPDVSQISAMIIIAETVGFSKDNRYFSLNPALSGRIKN